MMSSKYYQKGKKLLAVTLSVLLGLTLSMSFVPLDAHAEGDSTTENEITETPEQTVSITLTYNGEAVDETTIYFKSTDTTDDTQYLLTDVKTRKVSLPAGKYHIFIKAVKKNEPDFLIQGAELTVTENVPISYKVNFFCICFIGADGISLLSKQYVAQGFEYTAPKVAPVEGYTWLGWSQSPNGTVLAPLPKANADMTFYGVWEKEVPTHTHIYSEEWDSDETNHWHSCIAEDAPDSCDEPVIDIAPHTSDEGTVTTEPTTTTEGVLTYCCTVCKRILKTEAIPKLPEEPKHTHTYKWMSDEKEHWQECTSTEGSCDAKEKDRAAHLFDNGTITKQATETTEGEKVYKCTVCGYSKTEVIPKLPHTHKYGTDWKSDNTSHWHECTCGGKTKTAAHIAGEWIVDKQATVSAEGSRHKECTVCKKVLQTEAIAKLTAPTITKGANQIFRQGSNTGLSFTCSGNMNDLTGVYVANGLVHKSNYSISENGTVLTLHPAYLNSLGAGTHTLKLAYKNGTCAETKFTIQKNNTNAVKTGDNNNYIPLIILLILSGGVLIVTAVLHKRGYLG